MHACCRASLSDGLAFAAGVQAITTHPGLPTLAPPSLYQRTFTVQHMELPLAIMHLSSSARKQHLRMLTNLFVRGTIPTFKYVHVTPLQQWLCNATSARLWLSAVMLGGHLLCA